MKVVNISKAKYRGLQLLDIKDEARGWEADMYYLNYQGKDKAFKKLIVNQGAIFANKLMTLEELDSNREFLPQSFVVPEFLCSIQGELSGFAMPYLDGTNLSTLLMDKHVDSKLKVFYLRRIGDILYQLQHIRDNTNLKNLYIGDLHEANFMIDKNMDLRVVDVDSVKINENKPFQSKYLLPWGLLKYTPNKYHIYNKYISENNKYDYRKDFCYLMIDENTDYYCYLIMLLNFLYDDDINELSYDEYFKYINYLDRLGLDSTLKEAFIKLITDNVDNINPKDAVNTLDYRILSLAKKKIYEERGK